MDFESGEERTALDAWHAAIGAWRPHPLSSPDAPLPRATRTGVVATIAIAHALALWWLVDASRVGPLPDAGTVTTLVFIAPEPPPRAVPPPVRERERPIVDPRGAEPRAAEPRRVAPRGAEPRDEVPVESPTRDPQTPAVVDEFASEPGAMVAVEPPPRAGEPLRLYDADGSVALPEDVVARLADVDSPTREFDFAMPGLAESGRFLQHPPALAYESTRFDQYWIPEKDALTRILEKAVEATTGTVEIPIPGTRGGKLVCSVSILAAGGSCGVRNNADGYVVQLDDPATLSPEEDAQCRAWWDQIVAATGQDTWRHTRALYDANCRKPLAPADPADGVLAGRAVAPAKS